MAADPAMPDFWRYYGNKKMSDVDIMLIEEEPEAADTEAAAAAGAAALQDGGSGNSAAQPPAPPEPATATGAVAAVNIKPEDPAGASTSAAAAASPAVAAGGSKRMRQQGEHILGHGLVLSAFSGYCRTKLEDWDDATAAADQQSSNTNSRAKREIQLLVPAGQLEAGRLLIKGMYQQRPDLSGVTQAQLIQLLLLADRFEVPRVQAAVSAAFKALPPQQLQWETAMAVYGLPAGCAELAACQDLFSAAAAKLQHELGDLELALTDPKSSKALQLLELPFGALKQLLQDERTRVASENTVFFAIQQWHKKQRLQIEAKYSRQQQRAQRLAILQQQAQELLQLVRMPHCSQLFIGTVVGPSELAASCFSSVDLLVVTSFGRSATSQRQLPRNAADLPAFQRHAAWLLLARPPSALTQLTIDWQLPLAQLQKVFEKHLETGDRSSLHGDTRVWQALAVYPMVKISTDGTKLGFFRCAQLATNECRGLLYDVKAKSFKRDVPDVVHSSHSNRKPSFVNRKARVWGYRHFVELGAVSSWAEAEVVLRAKGLVGGDGCLHLSLIVSAVE